jgi:renalase
MKSIIIIGAGISGLIIGDKLSKKGFNIKILDKGNDIGGRLATKRIINTDGKESVFDFGAQYFTVRDKRFAEYTSEWEQSGVIKEWFKTNNESKYIAAKGMRNLAKVLGKNLDIRSKTRVDRLFTSNNLWHVVDADGNVYESDLLVITSPVQQSLDLLIGSDISIPDDVHQSLNKVSYHKCIAGLITAHSDDKVFSKGFEKCDGDIISWIADNYSKGISDSQHKLTVHTTPVFSEKHWNSTKDELKEILVAEMKKTFNVNVEEIHIHKWKYSLVDNSYKKPFEALKNPLPLILAGDGFVGGRIEAAAISGIEAAEYIIRNFR